MLELARVFGIAFATGFSGAVAPGPVLLVVIHQTARHGFRAAMAVIAGHAFLEIFIVGALAIGMAHLGVSGEPGAQASKSGAQASSLWFAIVKVVAGVMLAGFGALTLVGLRYAGKTPAAEHTDKGPPKWRRAGPVLLGVLASVTNPYFLLWWGTIGAGLIADAGRAGTMGLPTFYVGHILSDFTWYAAVAGSLIFGKSLLTARAYPVLQGLTGVFMVGFGAYFAIW